MRIITENNDKYKQKQNTYNVMQKKQKNFMLLKKTFSLCKIYTFYFVVKYDLKYVVIHPSM